MEASLFTNYTIGQNYFRSFNEHHLRIIRLVLDLGTTLAYLMASVSCREMILTLLVNAIDTRCYFNVRSKLT